MILLSCNKKRFAQKKNNLQKLLKSLVGFVLALSTQLESFECGFRDECKQIIAKSLHDDVNNLRHHQDNKQHVSKELIDDNKNVMSNIIEHENNRENKDLRKQNKKRESIIYYRTNKKNDVNQEGQRHRPKEIHDQAMIN